MNIYMTQEDKIKYNRATECEICSVQFSESRTKNRHHKWDKPGVNENGVVKTSNYLAAWCSFCYLNISLKYRQLPIFAHNGGRFDTKFVIDGYNNRSIIMDLRFMDSYNFFQYLIGESC